MNNPQHDHTFPTHLDCPGGLDGNPLAPAIPLFVETLSSQGYAEQTVHAYLSALACLSAWMAREHLPPEGLDEQAVRRFLHQHPKPQANRCPICRRSGLAELRAASNHLLKMLRDRHWIADPRPAGDTPAGLELDRFRHYLEDVCGLAALTCNRRVKHVGGFLARSFGNDAVVLARLKPSDVEAFVMGFAGRWSSSSLRVLCGSLNSYLRFKALCGENVAALQAGLPKTVTHSACCSPTSNSTARKSPHCWPWTTSTRHWCWDSWTIWKKSAATASAAAMPAWPRCMPSPAYTALQCPSALGQMQQILAIPYKRFEKPLLGFLSREAMQAILAAPDPSTWVGRRDRLLLALLHNTGARVSELVAIRAGDVVLAATSTARLHGKGRKQRAVPLWKETADLARQWMRNEALRPDEPLLPNRNRRAMSRGNAAERVALAARAAQPNCPALAGQVVTPHTIRHSTAMHLLQSGVDLTVTALWLGHESPVTTHGYVEADLAMKERALAALDPPGIKAGRYQANQGFQTVWNPFYSVLKSNPA